MEPQSVLMVRDLKHVFDGWGVSIVGLGGVSFELFEGEWCMLVGPNGAGKSTILNIISGMVPWSGMGQVEVCGRPLARLSPSERAKLVLHVRQDPILGSAPELTVAEHLALADLAGRSALRPLSRESRRKYESLLEPHGLASRLNQPVATLSGGERQILVLILAGLRGVRLLLLDEALSALDRLNADACLDLLRRLKARCCTILMVTHDLHLASRTGSRLIGMSKGKIVIDASGGAMADWDPRRLWETMEQGQGEESPQGFGGRRGAYVT